MLLILMDIYLEVEFLGHVQFLISLCEAPSDCFSKEAAYEGAIVSQYLSTLITICLIIVIPYEVISHCGFVVHTSCRFYFILLKAVGGQGTLIFSHRNP